MGEVQVKATLLFLVLSAAFVIAGVIGMFGGYELAFALL